VVIGIQVRAGDIYMDRTDRHCVMTDPNSELTLLFAKIKDHARELGEYSIFITSDYAGAADIANSIWKSGERVLTSPGLPQHLDKNPAGDFSKVYVDNYILSQKTTRLYVSDGSNYGRVAALSAAHDSLYSLSCKPLEKRKLVSKGERMF
jgi:ABC-type proline/glycine betaine transport system ATPase subunit